MAKGCTLLQDGYGVKDMLDEESATMGEMVSAESPLSKGFDIEMQRLMNLLEAIRKKIGSKKSAIAVLMGHEALDVMYLRMKDEETLETLADVEEGGVDKLDVDKQILLFLYTLYGKEYFDVGYQDRKQKAQLKANTQHLKNALCFVRKQWSTLM